MRWIKVLERVLATIPIMIGVAVIVFLFMRFTPGDPVDLMMGGDGHASQSEIDALKKQYNLDAPIHVQLYEYFKNLLRGDLGESFKKSQPVTDLIIETLPATIELALMATLFAVLWAFHWRVYSAVKQNSFVDKASMRLLSLVSPCLLSG